MNKTTGFSFSQAGSHRPMEFASHDVFDTLTEFTHMLMHCSAFILFAANPFVGSEVCHCVCVTRHDRHSDRVCLHAHALHCSHVVCFLFLGRFSTALLDYYSHWSCCPQKGGLLFFLNLLLFSSRYFRCLTSKDIFCLCLGNSVSSLI